MYGMEKVFEVFILFSDIDRLCPSDLGKSLIAFQAVEILSVIIIVFVLVSVLWEKRIPLRAMSRAQEQVRQRSDTGVRVGSRRSSNATR